MDRKRSRKRRIYADRQKKRHFTGNRFTAEKDVDFTSTTAKKLKASENIDFSVSREFSYCILNFFSVFTTIATLVVCKPCKSDIQFSQTSSRGLGFKICVKCNCNETFINSPLFINKAFEINRRIVFVFRLPGIAREGINLFCMEQKNENIDEYNEWYDTHEENCAINHSGSAGKMEIDVITEMFLRSKNEHGVLYVKYIGDGDSKTFIIDVNLYGNEATTLKKECVGHVEKRMGTRLRNIKKCNRGIGRKGAGKLTDKMIGELTKYYGLSIQLLERCLDAETQNNNESLNALIWNFALKYLHCGAKTIEISKEQWTQLRDERLALQDMYEKEEGALYGPGIAD
ncbi:hypothetical protein ALC57_08731 [Trachymyrmex cornetzi]|uniref:Mutator-like transposase domain-containing protein n=1 Tax=Trachymyrmex cornetzi TaxID=471704 RepID=A0A151J6P1_9HYME|nr:hypothetical protein ALC57_08731 [Trachymyrmex cornetzi]